jgi:hypothetical protein
MAGPAIMILHGLRAAYPAVTDTGCCPPAARTGPAPRPSRPQHPSPGRSGPSYLSWSSRTPSWSPDRPGEQVLQSVPGWRRRRARRSSSSSCVADPPGAQARTPWHAGVAPPGRTACDPAQQLVQAPPAIGQHQRLRCGPRPPFDLRLSSQNRIINGGRPRLLASPDRS